MGCWNFLSTHGRDLFSTSHHQTLQNIVCVGSFCVDNQPGDQVGEPGKGDATALEIVLRPEQNLHNQGQLGLGAASVRRQHRLVQLSLHLEIYGTEISQAFHQVPIIHKKSNTSRKAEWDPLNSVNQPINRKQNDFINQSIKGYHGWYSTICLPLNFPRAPFCLI